MSNLRKHLPRKCRPGDADFCLETIVDRGYDYLADGEDHHYFVCDIIPDDDDWTEIAEGIAASDDLLEFTARATPHGRYWEADKAETEVTWSATETRGR